MITEIKEEGKYEITSELPETIPPLPRKSNMDQKKKDYAEYTKEAVAREAIRDFGAERYGHKSIAQRYIAMNIPIKVARYKRKDKFAAFLVFFLYYIIFF